MDVFPNEFCISFSGKKKRSEIFITVSATLKVKDRFTTPAAYKLDQVNFLLFFRAE